MRGRGLGTKNVLLKKSSRLPGIRRRRIQDSQGFVRKLLMVDLTAGISDFGTSHSASWLKCPNVRSAALINFITEVSIHASWSDRCSTSNKTACMLPVLVICMKVSQDKMTFENLCLGTMQVCVALHLVKTSGR